MGKKLKRAKILKKIKIGNGGRPKLLTKFKFRITIYSYKGHKCPFDGEIDPYLVK